MRFRIADIFLPAPAEMWAASVDETEVVGSIVDFSDSGSALQAFAVVEVVRSQTVIVPIGKLRPEAVSGPAL